MPRLSWCDVLELPKLQSGKTGKVVCFFEVTDQGKLKLAHKRTEHVSESAFIEGSE